MEPEKVKLRLIETNMEQNRVDKIMKPVKVLCLNTVRVDEDDTILNIKGRKYDVYDEYDELLSIGVEPSSGYHGILISKYDPDFLIEYPTNGVVDNG